LKVEGLGDSNVASTSSNNEDKADGLGGTSVRPNKKSVQQAIVVTERMMKEKKNAGNASWYPEGVHALDGG
jgi:rare lipoprotein A (peptidoglycan hydrolase)